MNGIPGVSPAREIPINKKGSLSDQINNLEEQKKLLQLKLTLHKSLSLPKSMFMYRSVLFAIISLFISLSVYGQKERKIVILHTNDLHSRLEGFAPESMYTPLSVNDDRTLGGFARIASLISSEKSADGTTLFTVDGGDFLMGTLFHTLEASAGFQLPLMKKMGYDVVCIGNHEFDFGTDKLADIVNSSASNGPIPQILLGNAIFSTKSTADDNLENLFSKGLIKRTFIVEKDGIRAGFFSLMGKNAAEVAPYSAPVTFQKISKYAAAAVKELKSRGCDIIICLSHSGLTLQKDGQWGGEDAELARKVKGIDLIISGHTHTVLDKPLIVNGVPVVQTGEYGKNIGKVVFGLSDSGTRFVSYELIPVDDRIQGDRQIDSLISLRKTLLTEKVLSGFGMEYGRPVFETDYLIDIDQQGNLDESNLGPLVADAIYYYINRHNSMGCDVAMVSAGVIRDRIVPGMQTPADIFRIMPLGSGKDDVPGYPFSRLYVTGRELKNILEILLVAHKSNSDYYCFYSGMRAEVNPDKGLLRKVKKIDIIKPDGQIINVDFSKKNKTLYSISANSYMLEFIGIIKKKSFGLINVIPKNSEGKRVTDMSTALIDMDEAKPGLQEGKEWLALIEYLQSLKDVNGNGIPGPDRKYEVPVRAIVPVK